MTDEITTKKEIEAGMALTDKLEAFFYSEDLEEYLETDFFLKIACRETENLEESFSALPEKLRALAFHHAVLTDKPAVVDACVNAAKKEKANVDTDFCDTEYGASPLMQACFNACEKSFSSLVKGGASLSVKDNLGRGLAYACLFFHDLDFMQWAIKHGVEFDLKNPVDAVLPLAGAEGTVDVLKWLIDDLGGDVNFADAEGHTALYYACMATDMIRDLNAADAASDEEDDEEDFERQNRENILYLIDKGAWPTELAENAFKTIVDRIKELRAQRPSDVIDLEIAREIERLKEFANKL